MNHWLVCGLLGLCCWTAAAQAAPAIGSCDTPVLLLDARLQKSTLNQDWGAGAGHLERNAVLALRDCNGQIIDRLALRGPLARLDDVPLVGAPAPTWLVTVDMTAAGGDLGGLVTTAVEVVAHHLHVVEAVDQAGRSTPIRLASTPRQDWRRIEAAASDNLIAVSCQPDSRDGYVTLWRRFAPGPHGWRLVTRSSNTEWNSGEDFPPENGFPSPFEPHFEP